MSQLDIHLRHESDPSAHLLNLPRELRNHIYSYLTRQLDFDWDQDGIIQPRGTQGELQIVEPVPIRLLNSPLPHVFRIHSRMNAEYREYCLARLEAKVDSAVPLRGTAGFKALPHSSARNDATIARIRHLTLFIQLHASSGPYSLDWQDQLRVILAITNKTSHLLTLRVAVRQQFSTRRPTFPDSLLSDILVPATARIQPDYTTLLMPPMPHAVRHMPMVQRGEGYHIGFGSLNVVNANGIPVPILDLDSGCSYRLTHGIRKIGIYTYARQPDNIRVRERFWTVDEVVRHWPMRAYVSGIRQIFPEERVDWLLKRPLEMTEWLEKWGKVDVENWNTRSSV